MTSDTASADAPLERRPGDHGFRVGRLVHRHRLSALGLLSGAGLLSLWGGPLLNAAVVGSTWLIRVFSRRSSATVVLAAAFLVVAIIKLQPAFRNARRSAFERAVHRAAVVEYDNTGVEPDKRKLSKRIREDRRKRLENSLITISILFVLATGACAGLFVYATTPEISGRPPSRSAQAIQSAALVAALSGGAITLWLSNRRRRHDEATLEQSREELEQARQSSADELALSRQRAEEERFTAAIELLGHDDSSVRVGALHVLHGLAATAPLRRQTVVDVMSAYLRQPFSHPDWNTSGRLVETRDQKLDREREVRRTALRLIVDIVWENSPPGTRVLDVDLRGAELDEIDLHGSRLRLRAPLAKFYGKTDFSDITLVGESNFSHAEFYEDLNLERAVFSEDSTFVGAQFHKKAMLTGAQFINGAKFDIAKFLGSANFTDASFLGGFTALGAEFYGRVAFENSTFEGKAVFFGSSFARAASFAGVTFDQKVMFNDTIFAASVEFSKSSFGGGGIFAGAAFKESAQFLDITVGGGQNAETLEFKGAIFSGNLDFAKSAMERTSVLTAEFLDITQRPDIKYFEEYMAHLEDQTGPEEPV